MECKYVGAKYIKRTTPILKQNFLNSSNLCESFFKMIVYSFFDGYKCKLHVNRLSGLLNSMFGKKSWKRFENYS